MKELALNNILTSSHEQVLRTLLYFDIFNYPLNADEVYRFLGIGGIDKPTADSCLASLKERNVIYQFGELFSMKDDKALIERRVKGNSEVEKYLMLAHKKANFISKFPFVRAVLASGSLSKGYMDEKSDIDFFIITAPNRLWIARTLLVLYKRIFLFNSHKYFCVNYFVDEDHLEIEEKNLFTATELATVLPLCGSKQYEKLHTANTWLRDYYPNFRLRSTANVPVSGLSFVKQQLERTINTFCGNALEKFCQQTTLARWKRLYEKSYSATDFRVAFKSKSYASKNHPSNFQRTIMEAYEEKLRSFGISGKAVPENGVFLIHTENLLLQSTSGA